MAIRYRLPFFRQLSPTLLLFIDVFELLETELLAGKFAGQASILPGNVDSARGFGNIPFVVRFVSNNTLTVDQSSIRGLADESFRLSLFGNENVPLRFDELLQCHKDSFLPHGI